MKSLALVLVFATAVLADGFGHSNHRSGRRGGFRRPSARGGRRGGRQDDLGGGYLAPAESATEAIIADDYDYGEEAIDTYGNLATEASTVEEETAGGDPLAMLQTSIPGVPGEDYPIYAEVPESGFSCEGQVDGGYYADPEAECQVFHICTADGQGGLAKYSFLCPNGTIFNQNYFICDWWFNFDCAEAEALYSLNDDLAAERDAATGAGAGTEGGESVSSYAAPTVAADIPEYAEYPAYDDYVAETAEATEATTELPLYDYPLDDGSGDLGVYGEETTLAPLDDSYLSPAEEARRRRTFGRGNGRRNKQSGGRRGGRRQQSGRRAGRRNQKNRRGGQRQGRRNNRRQG